MKTKYELIANELRQRIMQEDYGINERIPQESELCKAFNASRITVRKALDVLTDEGLIYRIQGAGTFVKNNKISLENKHINFELFDLSQFVIKVVNFAVIKPEQKLQSLLEINQNDLVYEIQRTFLNGDSPVALNNLWMPIKLIQGMRADVLNASVYDFIRDDLDLIPESAFREYETILANASEANLLNIVEEEPLLKVVQHAYLQHNRLFEYSETIVDTRKVTVTQSLS